jgi:transposase
MELAKNKYVRRAKISEYKFRKMIKYFAEDLSATQIAAKIAINRNTVNRYLNEIRERIVEFCEQHAPFKEDEYLDSNKFLAAATASYGTTFSDRISTNLGIIKRRGKVYAEIIANCTNAKLKAILNGSVAPKVTVHAIGVCADDGLIAVGYDHNQIFARKPSHVANLDNFWSFVRQRTAKFQGMAKHKLYLHLKESEFRFNFRNDNLYTIMLQLISARPIS